MKIRLMTLAVLAALTLSCKGQEGTPQTQVNEDGAILTEVPPRAEGQQSALALTVEPIETVRIGFIGLGMRGSGAIDRYVYMPGVEIKALCDIRPEYVEYNQK